VRTILLTALVAAGLGSAVAVQSARDRWYPQVASPVDELYFSSGESLGRMALSFKSLLADVYWIRAVQYFGGTRLDVKNGVAPPPGAGRTSYDLLYPLLDVTTTLDPSFNIAYRFGATFLAEGYPNGPGRPDLAVTLLDKGFKANPQKWQYLYDKAFVCYWAVHDYKQAAHWFSEAARVPGSPAWMPGLAAFMLGQGGDRRASRFLWQQLRDTAEQQYVRDNAEFHLRQLDVADLADRLTALLKQYASQTGEYPNTFEPLIRAGWLRAQPADPDGVPFTVDSTTMRARLDRPSRYAPLPEEGIAPPADSSPQQAPSR
jgi:hypothetical protein